MRKESYTATTHAARINQQVRILGKHICPLRGCHQNHALTTALENLCPKVSLSPTVREEHAHNARRRRASRPRSA